MSIFASTSEQDATRRRAQLAEARRRLERLEEAWSEAVLQLRAFEVRYQSVLGLLLVELARARAELAALDAAEGPDDDLRRVADEAAARSATAQDEWEAAGAPGSAIHGDAPKSEELKRCYRDVARALHPDLVTDPSERERRTALMAEANRAYADRDINALRDLLARNHSDAADTSQTEDLVAGIAATWRRIDEVNIALQALRDSPQWQLKVAVEAAEARGEDLLMELRVDLERELADVNRKLIGRKQSPL